MNLSEDLFSYQTEDVARILNNEDSFLVLSEMGTGKTPTALGVHQFGKWPGKTLIVCPKTLQLEWARQIKDWCGIVPAVAKGGSTKRLESLFTEYYSGMENPFFIINYESFRVKRILDILKGYPFGLIILDEAHKLRNYKTNLTKGVMEFFASRSHIKTLILTGSPIVNNPGDLHILLSIIRPKEFSLSTRMEFLDRYTFYLKRRQKIEIYGVRDLEHLRTRTMPYTIRRTKEEVLPFLPAKYYRKVILEMEEDQRILYDKMRNDLQILLDTGEPLWAPSVLAELTRLRQLNLDPRILGVTASSSKTEFLKELLDDLGNEKLVVFTCFQSYIELLKKDLTKLSKNYVVIDGKVAPDKRIDIAQQFQTDPSIQICLGTLQTLGEGVTLTAASNCLFTDRWWNPALNNQGEDRLHRITQENGVQVIIAINDKSIDSSLDKILQRKAMYSDGYLGDRTIMQEVVDDMRHESRVESIISDRLDSQEEARV